MASHRPGFIFMVVPILFTVFALMVTLGIIFSIPGTGKKDTYGQSVTDYFPSSDGGGWGGSSCPGGTCGTGGGGGSGQMPTGGNTGYGNDGQGSIGRGIHPLASSAARRAGVTAGMISRGLYWGGGSGTTHGNIPGSKYGPSLDVPTRGMTLERMRQVLHNLRMQGFAAWYRDESNGFTPHIHAVYAGLPGQPSAVNQVVAFLDGRDGLGDHSFPQNTRQTAEEIAAVRSVRAGGAPTANNASNPTSRRISLQTVDTSGENSVQSVAFFTQLAPYAQQNAKDTGIPASVTLAQAALESAYGSTPMADNNVNNLFALHGVEGQGTVTLTLAEYLTPQSSFITTDVFRTFDNYADSITAHSKLYELPAYAAAVQVKDSPDSFALALQNIYSSEPNYGTTLISLMRRYNLYQYDQ